VFKPNTGPQNITGQHDRTLTNIQTNKSIEISYVNYVRVPHDHIYRPPHLLGSTDQQHIKNTYFLLVQGYPCPSRPSSSPGNNLHCVSGYRSRHSNIVCPGWVQNSRLADQDSTCWLDLHSTDPAGLSSRALQLLPSVTAALQPWPSSTVHSTFCEYKTRTEWLPCTLTYPMQGLPETWGARAG